MRIAAATGGCNYDMIAPIMDLIEKGNLDYIIFEMLSERTMPEAYRAKLSDSNKGYSPMLEDIFEAILPKCIEKNIKIVSNMGATNTESAVKKVAEKVIFANGRTYADALIASYLSKAENAPIILIEKENVPVPVKEYLREKKIKDSIILGGDSSIANVK